MFLSVKKISQKKKIKRERVRIAGKLNDEHFYTKLKAKVYILKPYD